MAVARRLLPLAVYAALAVVTTWPLALRLTTAVADLGDPLLNAWILDWDGHALTHAPLRIFDAPVFWPSKYPLAYSENLIAVAALVLPFKLAGLGAIGLHNIAMLLGLTLSAYAGYALARMFAGPVPAFIAGLLYGFVPYKLSHLAHVQIQWSLWPALLLAALVAYRRAPSWRNAAFIAASIVLGAMTNVYFFVFALLAFGAAALLIAVAERRDARFWLRLIGATAVAGVLLIPILRPYAVVAKEYEFRRGMGEALGNSATFSDWLIAPYRSLLYGRMTDPERRHNERELFPGLVFLIVAGCGLRVARRQPAEPLPATSKRQPATIAFDILILLAALATYAGAVMPSETLTTKFPAMVLVLAVLARLTVTGQLRRALTTSRFPLELWMAALWIAIGVVGSLGLNTFFHSFLLQYVPGFRATRVPARWAMIAYAGLVPWAAAGAASLAKGRRAVAALLVAAALLDVWPRIRWEMAPVERSPVDQWIGETKAGPVFFLPIDRLHLLYEYMLRATAHHQPIMNAISGFEPPLHRALRSEPLSDLTLDRLERNGYRFIVVRPDWAGPGIYAINAWLQQHLADRRLAFVRRFDYAINGDWVFEITRSRGLAVSGSRGEGDRETSRLRDLETYFAGRPVYNNSTFAQLYQPRSGDEVNRAMQVSGWALSPYGIREVNVLVDAGRRRFRADLFPRADVSALYPWYPQTPNPAFAVVLPKRPRGVPRETDVQIEIIDGRGEATRLRDVLLTWQ